MVRLVLEKTLSSILCPVVRDSWAFLESSLQQIVVLGLVLAEEVKSLFRVKWVRDDCPDSGVEYLYLLDSDYKKIQKSVVATPGPATWRDCLSN